MRPFRPETDTENGRSYRRRAPIPASSLGADALEQPSLGVSPVTLDRLLGNAEGDRRLGVAQPREEAELDHPRLRVAEEEIAAIDKEIKNIVIEAAKFAEEAPEPDASELHTDVLVESY